MGEALSYLAIKGLHKEDIWEDLRLVKSPEQDVQAWGASPAMVIGVTFSNGWYIVQDYSNTLLENERRLAGISKNADLLIGEVYETSMYSMAAEWQDGSKIWTVEHDLDKGEEHLAVSGQLPQNFKPIKARIIKERNATPVEERHDFYFSIPVDLFEDFTGFSYCTISNLATPSDYEFLDKAK